MRNRSKYCGCCHGCEEKRIVNLKYRNKTKVTCECGVTIDRSYFKTHLLTKKHNEIIKIKNMNL
jgi:hypothetical protein